MQYIERVTDPTLPAPQSAPKPSRAHTSRQRLAEFVTVEMLR
jgi:hypothetical protein